MYVLTYVHIHINIYIYILYPYIYICNIQIYGFLPYSTIDSERVYHQCRTGKKREHRRGALLVSVKSHQLEVRTFGDLGIKDQLQGGAPYLAFSWFISPITMVYR